MSSHRPFFRKHWAGMQDAGLYAPAGNPTFENPEFHQAALRVLILRLSPWQVMEPSLPHLFLCDAVRRAVEQAYLDLAFLPAFHDRDLLQKNGIPFVVGTQSSHSLEDFDLVLVSNSYVLELINLPFLLKHSGLPWLASQRPDSLPPIILGGSNAAAAHALILPGGDCIADALFVGEGEEQVEHFIADFCAARGTPKKQRLRQAAHGRSGWWLAGEMQAPIPKARWELPEAGRLPARFPVLNGAEAGTLRLPINLGCPANCSFCFEGFDRKPYRELSAPGLLEAARRVKQCKGADTLEIYSFNFNTHSQIGHLLLEFSRLFNQVGFKSQRVDILRSAPWLLAAEIIAGKSTFTLGIEGISQRQRNLLNKTLPAAEVDTVLQQLLGQRIRELKLFFILTGHEEGPDLAEFGAFVRRLKAWRQQRNPGLRILFSFGLLVRMPGTPFQFDRLCLDPQAWAPLLTAVQSACSNHGFEFRLAAHWPDYSVSQVLAMGGPWASQLLLRLAEADFCLDEPLPEAAWQLTREWLESHGLWNQAFLGEKPADYPFASGWVQGSVTNAFLFEQYQRNKTGVDVGYCLGHETRPGHCQACGACEPRERKAIVNHRLVPPPHPDWLREFRELMDQKARLKPALARVQIPDAWAGAAPEWLSARLLAQCLRQFPGLTAHLLSVREELFTRRELQDQFPIFSGHTVFGFKAWDAAEIQKTLRPGTDLGGFVFLGWEQGFVAGTFHRAQVEIHLEAGDFPRASQRFQTWLRESHVAFTLVRDGAGYCLTIPSASLKKKILFTGQYQENDAGFHAVVDVGSKCHWGRFFALFGRPGCHRLARLRILELQLGDGS